MRAIAIALILLLAGCSEPEPPAGERSVTGAESLETAAAHTAPVARETLFDGLVEAVNESTVAAQTGGRVVELPYDVGDFVPKDALIVRLTDAEQQSRAEGAAGTLAEARARFTEARLEFQRVQDLYERKLIARAELDRASANLESAEARVNAARAAVEEAREQLSYTEIRAPYAGTVVERHVQLGETVAPGTTLLTGLSLEHLRVAVEIPQQHIGPLRRHHQARVILNGDSVEASDLRIPPKADPSTHTFRVLVMLPEGDHGVYPGTLVKVAFVSGLEDRLLVPAAAVIRRGELTGVYVVDYQDNVGLRYVRTGTPTADGMAPVLSGLHPGEQVALDPLAAGIVYKRQNAGTGARGGTEGDDRAPAEGNGA